MRVESTLYQDVRSLLSKNLHFDIANTTVNSIENRIVGNLGQIPVNLQREGVFFGRDTVFDEDFVWGK